MMTNRLEVSVVIPAFNEAAGIRVFLEGLSEVLASCSTSFEICVVDDGSADATWSELCAFHKNHAYLKACRLTRNFGKEAAILAGLREARGAAVIVIDADGQHPIKLIPEMLSQWRSGNAQIVAAKKTKRYEDGLATSVNAKIFNFLMHKLSGLDLDGSTDYRLLDRRVVDALLSFPEKVRFFRGMTTWTGFATTELDFEVAPRIAGNSQWSTQQLTRFAITAITAYSAKPLGLIFRVGALGMLGAFLLVIQAIYSWAAGIAVSGWTSLTIVTLFFGSATLLGIGVLGAYLAQIFDEIKARPEFLIATRLDEPPNQE
jgi:glycosyltransferase involved in cell wall biosynthesis